TPGSLTGLDRCMCAGGKIRFGVGNLGSCIFDLRSGLLGWGGLLCCGLLGGGLLDDLAGTGQGGVGEEHVVAAQHVVGVELATLDQLNFRQVQETLDRVGVVDVDDDQRLAVDAEGTQQLLGVLGLRSLEAPGIDDDDLAVGGAITEGRPQRRFDHLLRCLLVVLTGLGTVGHTATAHVRRPAGALAGIARALLLERLLAATTDLGTGLGALGATAACRELRRDDLVHQRNVWLHAEHAVVEVEAAGVLTGGVLHGDRCHDGHLPFTALRTMTTPPLGPGTEPLTSSRLRSVSACTTSRFSVVTCSLPMWPAILRPLNTRPGQLHEPLAP